MVELQKIRYPEDGAKSIPRTESVYVSFYIPFMAFHISFFKKSIWSLLNTILIFSSKVLFSFFSRRNCLCTACNFYCNSIICKSTFLLLILGSHSRNIVSQQTISASLLISTFEFEIKLEISINKQKNNKRIILILFI